MLNVGQIAYLNSGKPVKVLRVETDRFGTWITCDAPGDPERLVVQDRDLHAEPPMQVDREIARLRAESPEFAAGHDAERVATGRTGKQD